MFQEGFGPQSVIMAANVMAVLAASKIPTLYLFPCISVLSAMGHVRFTATRSVIEEMMNVALSLLFILVFELGIVGVAAGTLAARLVVSSVAVPYYLCKKLNVSGIKFISYNLFHGFVAAILFSLYCFFVGKPVVHCGLAEFFCTRWRCHSVLGFDLFCNSIAERGQGAVAKKSKANSFGQKCSMKLGALIHWSMVFCLKGS